MSTVILDTITGKSTATTITIGSTPVVSASANSMTIRGEGSNQTSIQQGLCKAWCMFDGTGTPSFIDSFNFGSIADEGTGIYRINFTTNMGNATYSIQSHDHSYGNGWSDSETTGGYDTRRRNESAAFIDVANVWSSVQGDLA
jgi:hypothetical protein